MKEKLKIPVFRNRKLFISLAFLSPVLLLLGIINIFPFVSVIKMSFQNLSYVDRSGSFAGIKNYIDAIKNPEFAEIFQNTIVYATFAVAGCIVVGLFVAMLLNRPIPGRSLFRSLLIIPWGIPPAALGIVWRNLYSKDWSPINDILIKLGIIDSGIDWLYFSFGPETGPFTLPMFSMIFLYIWMGMPFATIMLLAGLQSIPDDLYEAAKIDGANYAQSFFSITLPILKPVMLVVTILHFIWAFSQFNINYLVTQGGPRNATNIFSLFIYSRGLTKMELGFSSAISVLMILLLAIPGFYYVRYILKGLGESFE